MKSIQEVASQGPRGPAYVRFSSEPVASTRTWEQNDDVVVDRDAKHEVVGIELVSIDPSAIKALVEVARLNDLDLSALVTRSFSASPAA